MGPMMLAAQVILKDQRPSMVEAVRLYFENLGFTPGETFAGNFSISGPKDTFERVFGLPLQDDALPESLPIQHLGEPVASAVSAVVFTVGYGPY